MSVLVLASASPRRREILEALGIEFEVVVAPVEELRDGDPERVVVENARRKARAGRQRRRATRAGDAGRDPRAGAAADPAWVLGVDTDVALEGRLLGKAADEAGARERLRALSGRAHEVFSGVVLLEPTAADGEPHERAGVARTEVGFRRLDEAEIERYLASGEWRDRAGAYAIQGLGSTLVESLQGDLSNVIGLPVALLLDLGPNLLAPGRGSPKL